MKIAMIGYGKMGKTIEQLAIEMGHEVPLKINETNLEEFTIENLKKVDVAIEFSTPSTAYINLLKCFDAGIPVVCGTTAWLDDYEQATTYCKEKKGAFLYASNFSIGVNIFFKLNEQLAKVMSNFDDYKVAVEEIHHTQKLDAPSGTAVTLTKEILNINPSYDSYQLVEDKAINDSKIIPITAKRIDKVAGTHTVEYQSPIDTITINHVAHSRIGFAKGAIHAAEWLKEKKGVFSMNDILGF